MRVIPSLAVSRNHAARSPLSKNNSLPQTDTYMHTSPASGSTPAAHRPLASYARLLEAMKWAASDDDMLLEMEALLRDGADPQATDSQGQCLAMALFQHPLTKWRSEETRFRALDLLLAYGANIDQPMGDYTLLQHAVIVLPLSNVEALLQRGANPRQPVGHFANLLERFAVGWSNADKLRLLCQYGHFTLIERLRAVCYAVKRRRFENVRPLLSGDGCRPSQAGSAR